ncbi:hypothetical protein BSZ39_12615, partial [Bowdeniella nasicola]
TSIFTQGPPLIHHQHPAVRDRVTHSETGRATKTWRHELDEIARDTALMGGDVSMFLDRINDGYELEACNDKASEEELTEIYRDAWLERKKFFEQREATGTRSNIEEAFDDLESKGVLARACFSCCGTCASSEIWGEFDESRPWQGYVYFHWQDAEALVELRTGPDAGTAIGMFLVKPIPPSGGGTPTEVEIG